MKSNNQVHNITIEILVEGAEAVTEVVRQADEFILDLMQGASALVTTTIDGVEGPTKFRVRTPAASR